MLKVSVRKLVVTVVVGLSIYFIMILWDGTKHIALKPAESIDLNPEHNIFLYPRNSAPKSAKAEKARVGKGKPHKEDRKKDSDFQTETTAVHKIHDSHSFSHNQTASVTHNITAVFPSQLTPTRPLNCSGCFHTDFPVLTDQPKLCKVGRNSSIDIVFLIVSAHKNHARRDGIRQSWASATRNNTSTLRHVFVLGTTADSSLRRAAEREARIHHDLIVIGFKDSYVNLTIKVVTALRWFTKRCPNARFFVKVDDDVWINAPVMTSLAKKNSLFLQSGIGGRCSTTYRPRREKKSKWYVPKTLYPMDRYPPYCQGLAYMGSQAVARGIIRESPNIPFFFLEDAYIGMCLKRLGFGVKNLEKFKHFPGKDLCQGQSSQVPTIHNVSPQRMIKMWTANCSVQNDASTAGGIVRKKMNDTLRAV